MKGTGWIRHRPTRRRVPCVRASVLRLWIDAISQDEHSIDDLIRFNEAIDQAVAESVGHFHVEVEQARNLLLGMLGHDMRSPLNTILTTATYLSALNSGETVSVAASRLIRSGQSMQSLIDDLVDFNRTKLGLGINIHPVETDIAAIIEREVDQLIVKAHGGAVDARCANGETTFEVRLPRDPRRSFEAVPS